MAKHTHRLPGEILSQQQAQGLIQDSLSGDLAPPRFACKAEQTKIVQHLINKALLKSVA